MAKRIILYIGTEKTGTTSWQFWLKQQRQWLSSKGFEVPTTLGPTNHRRLPTSFFNVDRNDDFIIRSGLEFVSDNRREEVFSLWQRAFAHEVQQSPEATWLVSSEHFSSRLTTHTELTRLREFLHSLFLEVEVHLVIRDPLQTAVSSWSTLVRNGGYPLEKLPRPDHPLLINLCNHRLLAERWQSFFPQLRIHIYVRNIVKLLVHASALPHTLYTSAPQLPKNPALPHRAIVEIARLNRHLPVYVNSRLNLERENRIVSILQSHVNSPLYIPDKYEEEAFSAYFADSLLWIQKRYFPEREILFT